MKTNFSSLALSVLLLAGCSREVPDFAPGTVTVPEQHASGSAEALPPGARLFSEHCAQCHGPQAQGHPDWQTPNDGSFSAAPPLDGSGPAVRRTKQDLLATIKAGVRKDGVDIMPGYVSRLSDEEIGAIVSWFQTLWPPEAREAWMKTNAPSAP